MALQLAVTGAAWQGWLVGQIPGTQASESQQALADEITLVWFDPATCDIWAQGAAPIVSLTVCARMMLTYGWQDAQAYGVSLLPSFPAGC